MDSDRTVKTRPINLDLLARQRREHSIFAPSSALRWALCAGSLIANVVNPRPAGKEAASGTVAHQIAQEWLRSESSASPVQAGEIRVVDGHSITIDDEMIERVYEYVRDCWETGELADEVLIERRVDTSRVMPIKAQGGTLDFAALGKGHAVVKDFKDGRVRVPARWNPQLLLYAIGLFDTFDEKYHFETFTLQIMQPRIGNYDEWTLTRDELLEFTGYIRERARLAWNSRAVRTPGSLQCEYCAESGNCRAQAMWLEQLTDQEFAALDMQITHDDMREHQFDADVWGPVTMVMPDYTRLSIEEMAHILPYRELASDFFTSMKNRAEEIERDNPHSIPGFKLVPRRKHRKWVVDKREVINKIDDFIPAVEIMKTSLLSPSQVEGLIKKAKMPKETKALALKAVLGLAERPDGGPELVPESDPRPEYTNDIDVDDAFGL
jgi:hypothetical protein